MPRFGQELEPVMSPCLHSTVDVTLDLAAVTPQQILAIAAALFLTIVAVCGAVIVLGRCFARCTPSRRRDLTSLVEAIVHGFGGHEPR
jgi:hypothetical protein